MGGLIGGVVKVLCEQIAPPRPPGRELPPAVLAEKMIRRQLTDEQKSTTATVMHFAFSVSTGAAYGALVELWPAARIGSGTAFGLAIWAGFHELLLPAAGATPKLADLPVSEQVNEFVTHAIFGVTVEAVRGALRPLPA
jgi:putative membrane protein